MRARQLLLVPLLSPLLAVLVVAALNPGPPLSIRVLTWASPRAPLGLWLASAALGGAALSGASTALALRQGGGHPGRRQGQGRGRAGTASAWSREDAWPGRDAGWEAGEPDILATETPWSRPADEHPGARASGPPARAPGEPAPTMEVPFRILRRGTAAVEGDRRTWTPEPAVARDPRETVPVGVRDDWDTGSANDDW